MAAKGDRVVPAWAVHPGEILREELLERRIEQENFARHIGVKPSYLDDFIKGKHNLSNELALKLERALGISYKTWMELHNGYIYDRKAIEERERKSRLSYEQDCDKIVKGVLHS